MRIPFQSLKFKIAGNLAFIILLSVLLSDVVIVLIIQKSLIHEQIVRGKQLLASFSGCYDEHLRFPPDFQLHDNSISNAEGTLVAFFCSDNGRHFQVSNRETDLSNDICTIIRQTLQQGDSQIIFVGQTFGVFWQQKKYVLVSEPVLSEIGEQVGAKLVVIQLDSIYQTLRESQKIIILYVVANFILLLLFGIYRLSRLIIRPIHRFIKMTDAFRDKDRLYFTHGTSYQEFNQLSKALNHMMDRIETDKGALRHSLAELEKANQELRNAQNEIIKAEKLASVGRLSAGIAHEIGNPIGIVLGYLDLLKARPNLKNDQVGQDFLKRAQVEINRINLVIRQLLDFSRSSSVDRKMVAMHPLIEEVVRMMRDQPFMSDIEINCRLAGDITDTVFIDREQIRQVIINLLINAADSIKASDRKDKGCIQITSEFLMKNNGSSVSDQQMFLLKVADNGTGISHTDIDYIFDPFFTTKEPGKGTGLGLSVSYMIIEQAGGSITAESEFGHGTTMEIGLPVQVTI